MIAGPAELETRPAVTQFTPIGPNKPLTILIREVYTGDQPRTLLGGKKPMAVVTGLKDYSAYAASSRAVNFLVADGVAPGARFKTQSTFDQGTNVVAYSPAVLADSLHSRWRSRSTVSPTRWRRRFPARLVRWAGSR